METGDEDEAEYALVLSFDSDEPEFTRGFEAGGLWERLKRERYIAVTIHATNAEMVMRMAEATGYTYAAHDFCADDEWVHIVLQGTPAESDAL